MSTGIGSLELQKGIVTALRANTTLTTLLASLRPNTPALDTGIYDAVPSGGILPYIVVGEGTENGEPTFGADGHRVFAAVEVWSADGETTTATTGAAGYRQPLSIADLVTACIMDDSITVSGHDVCVIGVLSVDRLRDDETPPYLRKVVLTYDILLEDS